jgi:glycosyltransferase involved in cell wall biosynthesis
LLLLVASDRRRGAEVFGERLTHGFRSLGWDVDFVALQAADSKRSVSADVLTDTTSLGRLELGSVRALRNRIASKPPSAILANGGATLRYAAAARSLIRPKDRPLLAYSSIGEPLYWLRSPKHTRLQRLLHAQPDLIYAVSDMTRIQLVEGLGVPSTRVHVAHTGVSQDYFLEQTAHHEEIRVLFLGSLSPEKDPMVALDIVDQLRIDCDITLRFVGDGPLAPGVATEIENRNLSEIVEMTGSVDDVRPHLEWADLLLLVSRTEGLPGAVLEAGAAGVPSVAFGVGGTSETMIPGESGIIITPGDTDAMVDAVRTLCGDKGRIKTMGTSQRDYIRTTFDLDSAVARYEHLLARALDESETP